MASKYQLDVKLFDNWKTLVIEKYLKKLSKLRISRTPQQSKPILKDGNVNQYLHDLHMSSFQSINLPTIFRSSANVSIFCCY